MPIHKCGHKKIDGIKRCRECSYAYHKDWYAKNRKSTRVVKPKKEKVIRLTTEQSFWVHVDTTPGFGPGGDCHKWTGHIAGKGYKTGNGYGYLWVEKRSMGAHRYSFLLANGVLDPTLQVLHSCDNPRCVNPLHLRQGTNKENHEESASKGRRSNGNKNKTHCKRGHALVAGNLEISSKGRACKECRRTRDRARPSRCGKRASTG